MAIIKRADAPVELIFPEDYDPEGYSEQVKEALEQVKKEIKEAEQNGDN